MKEETFDQQFNRILSGGWFLCILPFVLVLSPLLLLAWIIGWLLD